LGRNALVSPSKAVAAEIPPAKWVMVRNVGHSLAGFP
jgi:hypothetical protein